MVFGLPNPLEVATDWFSGAAKNTYQDIINAAKDNPELILIPVGAIALIGATIGASTAYGASYAISAGALDAVEDREEGFILPGKVI